MHIAVGVSGAQLQLAVIISAKCHRTSHSQGPTKEKEMIESDRSLSTNFSYPAMALGTSGDASRRSLLSAVPTNKLSTAD